MRTIGSPVNGDYNIYSPGTNIYNATIDASNPRLVKFTIALGDGVKNLVGAPVDEYTFNIKIGGVDFNGKNTVHPNELGQGRVRYQTEALIVPANTAVVINLSSDTPGDSDVDVTVQPYDVAPLQPTTVARTLEVESDGMAHSDLKEFRGGVPNSLIDGRIDSTMSAINNNTAAATRLALSSGQIIPGTVDTTSFTPTTLAFEADDITEATADHYIGRVVLWITGALTGQVARVVDYALVGSNGRFTVGEMTEAPSNNDTFVLI